MMCSEKFQLWELENLQKRTDFNWKHLEISPLEEEMAVISRYNL